MVRYGIIGSGMMGQEHIRNIRLLDGTAITGIADPNEQMRASAQQAARRRSSLITAICFPPISATPMSSPRRTTATTNSFST
jgi:predicted dehydrogenase